MAYTKVAVAGSTGNLGPSVVKALIDAGFSVTLLSQSGKTDGLPSQAKTVKVDYNSEDSIVSALQGQEAFVCMVPDHGSQPKLVDAAIKAGVKRFIPSEFGANVAGNSKTAALPVFKGKKLTQDYLAQKSSQISYTFVCCGAFLDWGIKVGFVVNVKDGSKTRIFDDGDAKYSMSLLRHVGQAVVGILQHPDETKNKAIYIQSAAVSQNQILDIAQKKKPALKLEREPFTTEDLLKEAYGLLEQGGPKIRPAMIDFILVSQFNKDYGNNWETVNDNALLGIKGISQSELEDTVAEYL